MSENLDYEYDQVVSYINSYREFTRKISGRVLPFKEPVKYFRFLIQIPKMYRQINPLSDKILDLNRMMVSEYATEEERTTDLFKVAISDYPTDALSDCLKKEFNNVNFEKLKKLHDLRKTRLERFNVKSILGFVFAGATLVMKSVPKGFVEKTLGVIYDDFELWIFYATLGLIGYLLLVLIPSWWKFYKAKLIYQYVGEVMEYTVIKTD